MTESDLRDARADVEERIEGRRQRDRRRGLVVAAAAAAVVVGVATWQGLSGEDASPSPGAARTVAGGPVGRGAGVPHRRRADRGDPPGVWRLDNSTTSDAVHVHRGRRLQVRRHRAPVRRTLWSTAPTPSTGDTITVDVEGGSAGCAGHRPVTCEPWCRTGALHVVPVDATPSSCGRPSPPVGAGAGAAGRPFVSALKALPVPTGTRRPATTPCWATGTTRRAATSSSCGTTGPTRSSPGARRAGRQRHLDRRRVGHPAHLGQRGGLADVSRGGPVRPRQPAGKGRRRPGPPGRPRTQRLRRGVAGHRVVPAGPVTRSGTGAGW